MLLFTSLARDFSSAHATRLEISPCCGSLLPYILLKRTLSNNNGRTDQTFKTQIAMEIHSTQAYGEG